MEGFTLSPKQTIAAAKIAVGESQQEAAKAAKVTPQTVSEWMQQPQFRAVINQVQLSLLFNAQDKLRGLVLSAIDNLSQLLKESKNENVRLDAAKYVLDTVRISPSKDIGLWYVGATTPEDVIRDAIDNPTLLGLVQTKI